MNIKGILMKQYIYNLNKLYEQLSHNYVLFQALCDKLILQGGRSVLNFNIDLLDSTNITILKEFSFASKNYQLFSLLIVIRFFSRIDGQSKFLYRIGKKQWNFIGKYQGKNRFQKTTQQNKDLIKYHQARAVQSSEDRIYIVCLLQFK